jgi:hypothetical protein
MRSQHGAQHRKGLAYGAGQRARVSGKSQLTTVRDEERICKILAQASQSDAHARLRYGAPLGRKRDASLTEERIQSNEQI